MCRSVRRRIRAEAAKGKFMEETLADCVESSFRVPVAAIVAPARVNGESDAWLAGGCKAGVVGIAET
jgi:hypothetical protein